MAVVDGVKYPTGTDTHPSAVWWAGMATSIAQRINAAASSAIASAASTSASGDAQTLTAAKSHSDSTLAAARQALEQAIALRPTGTVVTASIENAVKPLRDLTETGRLSPGSIEQLVSEAATQAPPTIELDVDGVPYFVLGRGGIALDVDGRPYITIGA